MPLLVNLLPSGKFLMEDFYYAGGLPVVMKELMPDLHGDVVTVNGRSLAANVQDADCYNHDVIASRMAPFQEASGIAVLRGNLCEDGAIIKPSAATPSLMVHRGRAVVFEDIDDYHNRVDDPALDVDEHCILVLKHVGPKGYPGMPEVGNFHIPKKIAEQGVTDMVRISDGRMSGTAYGTVILHVAPESAVGGALALVREGDMIEMDVANRRLHLDISEAELETRRLAWQPRPPSAGRGYVHLYLSHVQQADKGVDFDFLVGKSGAFVSHGNH